MAKCYGVIGYATPTCTDGVWEDSITEREYYGELERHLSRRDAKDSVNDDIVFANDISIIADPFALQNLPNIRYITYLGCKWNVSSVEYEYPRIRLSLGGVFSDQT